MVLEEVVGRHKASLPPALQGISLTLAPGEKVGVVGRTGAGKSTLASLLLRVVEPCGGRVSRVAVASCMVELLKFRC